MEHSEIDILYTLYSTYNTLTIISQFYYQISEVNLGKRDRRDSLLYTRGNKKALHHKAGLQVWTCH